MEDCVAFQLFLTVIFKQVALKAVPMLKTEALFKCSDTMIFEWKDIGYIAEQKENTECSIHTNDVDSQTTPHQRSAVRIH